MRLTGMLAVGLLVLGGAAHAEQGTATPPAEAQPPATTAPPPAVSQSGTATTPAEVTPPAALAPLQNVNAEPSTAASAELASRAATAEMKGDPQESVKLADQAIRADAKDPWPYYDKGMALARVGETNGALAALLAAEQHFSPYDRWGRSVAVFGRAPHAGRGRALRRGPRGLSGVHVAGARRSRRGGAGSALQSRLPSGRADRSGAAGQVRGVSAGPLREARARDLGRCHARRRGSGAALRCARRSPPVGRCARW